jgi:hypothetical protein
VRHWSQRAQHGDPTLEIVVAAAALAAPALRYDLPKAQDRRRAT